MIWKRIKGLDVFWRKVFIFAVLLVLAAPLVLVIAKNFEKRAQKAEGNFLEDFQVPEFEEMGNFEEVKEALDLELFTTTTKDATEATTTE